MNEFLSVLVKLPDSWLGARVTIGDVTYILVALGGLALIAVVLLAHEGILFKREHPRPLARRVAGHHWWMHHRH